MIVAIHQPCFLPWPGYLQRMARADLFVLLDHVQFERQNYQNRTRIRVRSGAPAGSPRPDYEARWLTVPVVQRSRDERILEKDIDHSGEGRRHWAAIASTTLRHAYREAAYADRYLPELNELLSFRWAKLAELNEALLGFLREAFAIRTPMVRSSALGVSGAKSALVLDICRAVGARTFLGGMGGSRRYLDAAAFAEAGIGVQWQEFQPPNYPQCGAAPFIPGLSSLDLLLNCGPRGRDLFAPWESQRHSSPAPSRPATQAVPS